MRQGAVYFVGVPDGIRAWREINDFLRVYEPELRSNSTDAHTQAREIWRSLDARERDTLGDEYSRRAVGDRFYQGPVPGAVWAELMHLAELTRPGSRSNHGIYVRDEYDRPNPGTVDDVRVGTWWRDDVRGDRAKITLIVSRNTVYYQVYPRNGGEPWTTRQAIDAFLRAHTLLDDSA